MKHTIGIDLGGTKLAAALVTEDGKILDFIKVPVNLKKVESPLTAQRRIIQTMVDIVLDFKNRFPKECSPSRFQGIGLASAGPMDVSKGLLVNPMNYPGWKVVPIRQRLEGALQKVNFPCKIHFQNDAMSAALAEGWVGSAKKLTSYAVVTVGTGIGTGVILNRRPCQTNGAGSEFGHSILQMENLKRDVKTLAHNTVEGLASGTALVRRAKELGFNGNSVEELVATKDPIFKNLYNDMALALACLCYNLSIGFRMEGIFLSGGLIKIQELYFRQMEKQYRNLIKEFNSLYECPIRIAKTKNKAGVLGAAFLPWLKD